ncbi:MAG TPA: hypothetical protein VLA77_03730 [Candidatus Saccharimonadales bacterium]|nr:hypothetical protein [Candidatus Saccharimonadales bacterium]
MAQYRQGRETRDLEQRVRQSIPKALAISDLLDEFHKLHLIDRELLLNWLVRFGQAWHVGTTVDSRAIARRLLETGLYNEIRVPEGIPNNRQEHADLLIGQAIAWLQDGRGFEEVFPTVVERWRDRW